MNMHARISNAVVLRNLSRSFKGKSVLDRISLDIPRGQFVSLLGESGSGKTTLLRALAGLDDDAETRGHFTTPENKSVLFQDSRLLPAAGVFVDPGITSTEDIDLVMDARQSLRIMADAKVEDGTLINLLRKVDRSFERSSATFRALNRDGYLVDLIKPLANPVWKRGRETVGKAEDELVAVEIAGLAWLENAPVFEAIAIDEKGGPLRLIVPDPRIFAAHKFWVSKRADRDPIKRRRDLAQAQAVAQLTTQYLKHLPYEASELRVLPRAVFDDAHHLFI